MPEKTIFVDCPHCQSRLEVIAETGKVTQSWKKENLTKSKDFIKEALKRQEKEKSRLDKYFEGAGGEIKKRKKELSKQFEKEKNRIHKEKDYDKPEDPFRWD
jgi:hypothetical protein